MGVMAMVVVLSVMSGFGENMKDRLLSVEPHLVIRAEKKEDRREIIGSLEKQKGVEALDYEAQDLIIRTQDGNFGAGEAKGYDEQALKKMIQRVESTRQQQAELQNSFNYFFVSYEELKDKEIKRNEVILGADLARSLGVFEGDEIIGIAPEGLLLPVGEAPPVANLQVIGLLQSNTPEIDGRMVYYKKGKTLRQLGKTSSFHRGVEVRFDDPDDFAAYEKKFEKQGFLVESWAERNSALFYSLKMEKILMTVFLSLTLLVGSFSIITVLVMLGTQKRKDMGLLMALGQSPKKTRGLMTKIGFMLSGLGVGLGLALGLIFTFVLDNYAFIQLPDIYYDTTIPVKIEPLGIALVVLISLSISLIAAWLPAYLTVERSPADSLRSRI